MKNIFVSIPLSVFLVQTLFVQTAFAEGYYYFYDHLGNVDVVTDETGEAVATYDYDPFGNTIEENIYDEDFENDYKYTGQEEDDETGLYYYNARYYSPMLGRFMSQDPAVYDDRLFDMLEDPQSLNPYAYARNNPVKYVDPSGEEATVIFREKRDGQYDDFGHTAIEVNGTVYHFYADSSAGGSMLWGTDGVIGADDGIEGFVCNNYTGTDSPGDDMFAFITLDTTSEQDASIVEYFEELMSNTPNYSLLGTNCTTTIEDALEYAGIADFSGWHNFGVKGSSYYETRPLTPSGLKSRLGIMNDRGDINIINSGSFRESNIMKFPTSYYF